LKTCQRHDSFTTSAKLILTGHSNPSAIGHGSVNLFNISVNPERLLTAMQKALELGIQPLG
jgi:hypothetical protein